MARTTLAAFDFDGTLTRSDTLPAFLLFAFGGRRFLCGLLRNLPFLAACKCRLYSNGKAKQRLFGYFFKGMPLDKFNALCEDFCRTRKEDLLRPEAARCVGEHLCQGHEVVIVSASISNWVSPFARHLGIVRVIGTEVEVADDGRLTGRFSTPNCHGAEKVRRLRQLFPARDGYFLVAYGDSRGDRELLSYADEAHYKSFMRGKNPRQE